MKTLSDEQKRALDAAFEKHKADGHRPTKACFALNRLLRSTEQLSEWSQIPSPCLLDAVKEVLSLYEWSD